MPISIAELIVTAGVDKTQFDDGMASIDQALQTFARTIQGTMQQASTAINGPFDQGAAIASQFAARVDASMQQLVGVVSQVMTEVRDLVQAGMQAAGLSVDAGMQNMASAAAQAAQSVEASMQGVDRSMQGVDVAVQSVAGTVGATMASMEAATGAAMNTMTSEVTSFAVRSEVEIETLGRTVATTMQQASAAVSNFANTSNTASASAGAGHMALAMRLMGVGQAAQMLGMTMENAGHKITGTIIDLAKQGADYQQTIQRMGANTTMTAGEIAKMDATVRQLGTSSPAALDKLAAGFMHLVNLGISAKDAPEALRIAMQSAVATGGDVAKTAELLGKILHNFHLSAATDSARTMALLHQAAAQGNQTLEQFVAGTNKAYASAAQYHVSLVDTSAALSMMTRAGFPAAQSATQFAGMINAIVTPSQKAQKELIKLGEDSGDKGLVKHFSALGLQTMQLPNLMNELAAAAAKAHQPLSQIIADVFPGQRGRMNVGALLLNNTRDFNEIKKDLFTKMQGKEDPTAGAFKTAMQGINNQLATFRNQMQILGADIAKIIGPMLTPVIEWAKQAVAWFHALSPAMQENIVKFSLIGGVVLTVAGAFLAVVGQVASFAAMLSMAGVTIAGVGEAIGSVVALLTGPVGWAIAAVVAVIALLVAAWKNDWGQIREHTQAFVTWISPYLSAAWKWIVSEAKEIWGEAVAFFKEIWPPIKTAFMAAWVEIRAYAVATWTFLTELFKGTGHEWFEVLKGIWDIIAGVVKFAWGVIAGIIVVGLDLLSGHWSEAWQNMQKYGSMAFNGLLQMFSGFFETIGHVMQAGVIMMTNSGRAVMEGFKAGIKDGISGALDVVKSMGNDVSNSVRDALGIHSPSRVFHEIGQQTVKGFADGIHEENARSMKNTGYIIPQTIAAGVLAGSHHVKDAVKKTTDDADAEMQKWQDHLEKRAQNIADVWKKIFDLEHSDHENKRRDVTEDYYTNISNQVPANLAMRLYADQLKHQQKEEHDAAVKSVQEQAKKFQDTEGILNRFYAKVDEERKKDLEKEKKAADDKASAYVDELFKRMEAGAHMEAEQRKLIEESYRIGYEMHAVSLEDYKKYLQDQMDANVKNLPVWQEYYKKIEDLNKQAMQEDKAIWDAYSKHSQEVLTKQEQMFQDLGDRMKTVFSDAFDNAVMKGQNFFNSLITGLEQTLLQMAEKWLNSQFLSLIGRGLDAAFPGAGGAFGQAFGAASSAFGNGSGGSPSTAATYGFPGVVPIAPPGSSQGVPLSRAAFGGGGSGAATVINMHVHATDAASFHYSEGQIGRTMGQQIAYSQRRGGN